MAFLLSALWIDTFGCEPCIVLVWKKERMEVGKKSIKLTQKRKEKYREKKEKERYEERKK